MSTPESKIQLAILKELRAKGVFCWRAQPHTYNAKLGFHVSNPYSMPGQSDIIAILPPHGRFIGIEVKTLTGRVSSDQILFKKRLENVGGVYVIARNVADIKDILNWG